MHREECTWGMAAHSLWQSKNHRLTEVSRWQTQKKWKKLIFLIVQVNAGFFFKCKASTWVQKMKKKIKRKIIRTVNYKGNILDSRSLQSKKNILRKHDYIFDLFFFSSFKYLLLSAWWQDIKENGYIHPMLWIQNL